MALRTRCRRRPWS